MTSFLKQGSKLLAEGKLEEAVALYRQAIAKMPPFAWYHYGLGNALTEQGNYKKAVDAYCQAIAINNTSALFYCDLGRALEKSENLDFDKFLEYYQNAILIGNSHDQCNQIYLNLAIKLVEEGYFSQLLNFYRQSFKHIQDASYYHKLAIALSKKGKLDEAIVFFKNAPQPQPEKSTVELGQMKDSIDFQGLKREELYENIWRLLNQPNEEKYSEILSESRIFSWNEYRTNISPYFLRSSSYKHITLTDLSLEDATFLDINGISIANLKLIKDNNVSLEEIYINNFTVGEKVLLTQASESNIPAKVKKSKWYNRDEVWFQQSIIETGYIYSVCPFSGEILRSNQSFYFDRPLITIYRFVGREVFYLLAGDLEGKKRFIYFPSRSLIIRLDSDIGLWADKRIEDRITSFKSYLVKYYDEIIKYISTNDKKKVAAVVASWYHLGHYIYNELTAIQSLVNKSILEKVDLFLVSNGEFVSIDGVFPEIPENKICRNVQGLFQTSFQKNYFLVRLTDCFVDSKLADRILNLSFSKCSDLVIKEVEEAKALHPLIWINIRVHNRIWISQERGIACILEKIYENYPSLGVVFSGWSRTERKIDGWSPQEDTNWENIISQEKEVVSKILSFLEPDVKSRINVYDTIGCNTYESIVWASAVDVCIGTHGGGFSSYMRWINSKPGVTYGPPELCHLDARFFFRENSVTPLVSLSKSDVTKVDEKQNDVSVNGSYSCDWKAIYREISKIIDNIKTASSA